MPSWWSSPRRSSADTYPKGPDFGARTATGSEAFRIYYDGAIDVPGPQVAHTGEIAADQGTQGRGVSATGQLPSSTVSRQMGRILAMVTTPTVSARR